MFGQAKASFLVSNPREQRICTIGEAFRVLKSRIFQAKESQPQTAAMPNRTALLVESSASRQIFLSIRPYHDGVLDRACTLLFLSRRRITSRIFRLQHRDLAHRAGHALPE